MKSLILAAALILLFSVSLAADPFVYLNSMKTDLAGTEEKPDNEFQAFIVKYFGNENAVLNFVDDKRTYTLEIKDAKITNIAKGPVNGTVEINIKSTKLLTQLLSGEGNPKESLKNDDLNFRGLTTTNKIKYGFINFLIGIWLSIS